MTGADEAADRETDTARDHWGLLRNILKANHKRAGENRDLLCAKQFQPRHKVPKVSLHPVRSSAVNHDISACFLQPNNQIETGEADWKVYL